MEEKIIQLDENRWIANEADKYIVEEILKQIGAIEEKPFEIIRIGVSAKKNLKFIEKSNRLNIQAFDSESNEKINNKIRHNNIKFITINNEYIELKLIFPQQQHKTSNKEDNYSFLDKLSKDKGGWFIYANDVNIFREEIRNSFSGLYQPDTIAGIGISKKGFIKITQIDNIFKTIVLTKKQNTKVLNSIKNNYKYTYFTYNNRKSEEEKKKNFFTFLYPKAEELTKKIEEKLYMPKNSIKITSSRNYIETDAKEKKYKIPFISKEIIEEAEKISESKIDIWFESFINKISDAINSTYKNSFLQERKLTFFEESINQTLQSLEQKISNKYFRKQETKLIFVNNFNTEKYDSNINIKIKSKNIIFEENILISKSTLQTIFDQITSDNIEEKNYKNINLFFKIKNLKEIKAHIKNIIEQRINNGHPFYANRTIQNVNNIPIKIKKHLKTYKKIEQNVPCWFIFKPNDEDKIKLYPPNKIIFDNRFFVEKANTSEALVEKEYAKKLRISKEDQLKNTLNIAKEISKKLNKLNINIKIKYNQKATSNQYAKSRIILTDNISGKEYNRKISQEITDINQNEENNNKIIAIINEVEASRKTAIQLAENLSHNILNIAVADIIFLNEGTSKSAIIANLRGTNNSIYKYSMKNNSFTDKLNLVDKNKIEEAINQLDKQKIISNQSKYGKYGTFTAYYPNETTKALHIFWESKKDEIFKQNNMILKDFIQKLTKVINEGKTETFKIQDFMPLIEDKINIIDYSINLEALKEVFRYAPDDIIKLMSMKKKLINDPARIKVYNTLIKAQKDYKKLIKEATKHPEKFELQEQQ